MHRLKTHWDKLVLISLLGICAILILNLLLPMSHEQKLGLELIDIIFLSILAVDIYKRFKIAHDKSDFLKKNWIEIIVLVPFGAFSEIFRIGELLKFGEILEFTRFFKFAQFSVHAKELMSLIPLSIIGITLHRQMKKEREGKNKRKAKSGKGKTGKNRKQSKKRK